MTRSATGPAAVLAAVDSRGPPGTPLTTPEVAEGFDCSTRTIYNRLEALVEDGKLATKKVGANGRVWWRPPEPAGETRRAGRPAPADLPGDRYPVFDSRMVGVVVWGPAFTIRDANDAFLEMSGLAYDEAVGTSWRELTPDAFHAASERHIVEVETTGEGVPYEKQYYHADGSRWWGLFESRRVSEDEIVEFVVDVTARKRREADLRESEERLEAFVTTTSEVVYRMSPDWSEMYYLDGQEFVADTEEPRATWVEEYIPADERERVMAAIREAIETTSPFELEHQVVTLDGTRGWVHARAIPILDDGAIVEWFGTSTDITERKRAERTLREGKATLERLNEASRELIDAEADAISDRVVPIVRTVVGIEYAALWRYDDRTGSLEEHAADATSDLDVEDVAPPTAISASAWRTFVGSTVTVEDGADASPIGAYLFVPLGRHGVVVLGRTGDDGFDEGLIELVETVAATVETAWDRAESERELERRNEELTYLDRLNALIRAVDQGLVEADTTDRIDEVVCERLAASALFEFAWIGEYDPATDAVRPQTWAGLDGHAVEALTAGDGSGGDRDPFVTAVRTRELQLVADVATDAMAAPWREVALEHGARSCLAIPLVYHDSVYGILAVYGATPTRRSRDADVLSELGDTVAHAINAVETRETLQTNTVAELTIRTTAATTPLCRLARRLGTPIEFEGLVPGADDATLFFTIADASPAEVLAAGEAVFGLDEVTCLVDGDASDRLFWARASEPTLASLVVEGNAVVRSLSIGPDAATAVVDVFRADRVGSFLDRLRETVPDAELLVRRTQSRPLETRQTFRRTLEERLTPRQREVLLTAYRSGFFRSPRAQTGTEVAAALGISPATFTHHIRRAEGTLCDLVFDPD